MCVVRWSKVEVVEKFERFIKMTFVERRSPEPLDPGGSLEAWLWAQLVPTIPYPGRSDGRTPPIMPEYGQGGAMSLNTTDVSPPPPPITTLQGDVRIDKDFPVPGGKSEGAGNGWGQVLTTILIEAAKVGAQVAMAKLAERASQPSPVIMVNNSDPVVPLNPTPQPVQIAMDPGRATDIW